MLADVRTNLNSAITDYLEDVSDVYHASKDKREDAPCSYPEWLTAAVLDGLCDINQALNAVEVASVSILDQPPDAYVLGYLEAFREMSTFAPADVADAWKKAQGNAHAEAIVSDIAKAHGFTGYDAITPDDVREAVKEERERLKGILLEYGKTDAQGNANEALLTMARELPISPEFNELLDKLECYENQG